MDKLPSLPELGRIVRQTRKQEKLSQKALADLVGVSHVTVLAVEKGTGKARLENTWKILTGLGLAVAPGPRPQVAKEIAQTAPIAQRSTARTGDPRHREAGGPAQSPEPARAPKGRKT